MIAETGIEDLFQKRICSSIAVMSISFFTSMVLPHQFSISVSSVKRLPFICIDVYDIISKHFTLSYRQENLWDRSRWLTNSAIL